MARKGSTSLAKYDEMLAQQALEVTEQEASAIQGAFFSIRGGTLQFNGAPIANNQMAVIICDSVMENVLYEGKFDPDNPSGPACYAFGRSERQMAPHEDVKEPVAEACGICENNEWGSRGDGSRGKACKNRRRLALISAGAVDAGGNFTPLEDPEDLRTSPFGFLPLPVTSVKAWGQYVHTLANVMKRPPHGVITLVRVEPDQKTMVRVVFEPIGPVDKKLLPIVMDRHEEAKKAIIFGYPEREEQEAKPKGRRTSKKSKSKSKRKTTKKTGGSRRF